jgi:hypothetical protein
MTTKEKSTFKKNVLELIEHVRLYGVPKEESTFVIDKMMFFRMRAIKNDPEKLELANKLDKNGILF